MHVALIRFNSIEEADLQCLIECVKVKNVFWGEPSLCHFPNLYVITTSSESSNANILLDSDILPI